MNQMLPLHTEKKSISIFKNENLHLHIEHSINISLRESLVHTEVKEEDS